MSTESSIDLDDVRAFYDEWYRTRPQLGSLSTYRRMLAPLLTTPLQGRRVLDVSCGPATWYSLLPGAEITGFDLSWRALEIARSNQPTVAFTQADAQFLPYRDAAFHAAVNLGSLEHLPDPALGVREMVRVLQPGGLMLVVVPNLFSVYHLMSAVRDGGASYGTGQVVERLRPLDEWRKLFEGNGLSVVSEQKDMHPSLLPYREIGGPRSLLRVLFHRTLAVLVPLGLSYQFVFLLRSAR